MNRSEWHDWDGWLKAFKDLGVVLATSVGRGICLFATVYGIHHLWWSAVPTIDILPAIYVAMLLNATFMEFRKKKIIINNYSNDNVGIQ